MTRITSDVWDRALDVLRERIGEAGYRAWLLPVAFDEFSEEDGRVVLSVPNEFYRRWIASKYLGDIAHALSEVAGEALEVDVRVAASKSAGDITPLPVSPRGGVNGHGRAPARELFDVEADEESGSQPVRRQRGAGEPVVSPEPKLNSRYIFREFVVGESNRFAYAAAEAVADPKSKAYNPLFIYGGSGLGKTHLMQAIGHAYYQADKSLRILYVTSEMFVNEFIESIQSKRPTEFRAQFRNVDLLLIDDVHFLTGKERTQQEFFHTFNALFDANKKIVVTSDRPPKELPALEERLRTRFEWGLIVDIQPPDLETRIAILSKKAEYEGFRLAHDVALYVAERVTDSIRELEGTLKRLKAYAGLHNRPVNLEVARTVLGHLLIGRAKPRIGAQEVLRAVCEYFEIKPAELTGANRSKKFSEPRHIALYLSRELTGLSFPDIAQQFGGKDHTSVIYAHKKVRRTMEEDANVTNVVAYLTKQITKGSG